VTQPPSLAVLVGETVTLCVTASGSRPLSYQWLFNGAALPGQSNSCLVLPSVTTNSSGGYKVIVSNSLGTVTSDRAQLTVSAQGPHITSQPASLSLQAGDTAVFAVSASGGPLFYQWRHDDVALPGATNAVLRIESVTHTNEGTYQVVVSNLLGYVTSLPATLAVAEFAPSFLTSPQDVDTVVGSEVSLLVSVQAAPPARLQWRHNGVDLPGETFEFLALHAVTTNQAGLYTVWATNSVGGTLSSPGHLTVGGRPPEILEEPADVSVRPGEAAFFEVIAVSVALQWSESARSQFFRSDLQQRRRRASRGLLGGGEQSPRECDQPGGPARGQTATSGHRGPAAQSDRQCRR
jgi:plastocyanin